MALCSALTRLLKAAIVFLGNGLDEMILYPKHVLLFIEFGAVRGCER